jgi:outer membrane autotransporter protein
MKNKFLKLFVIINIVFFTVSNLTKAAFADILIVDDEFLPTALFGSADAGEPNILVTGDGSLNVVTGAVAVTATGTPFGRLFGITVDTTSTNPAIGATNGLGPSAVKLIDSVGIFNINRGTITSNASDPTSGTVFWSRSSTGTNIINISSNGKISNTATSGNAINLTVTGAVAFTPTNLNITNEGIIETVSHLNSNAILIKDPLGGINLNVDNSGTINAGVGHAIKTIGNNKTTIVNSGNITGNIDLGTHAASSITLNSGSLTGNITTGNVDQVINLVGGRVTGNVALTGELNLAGVAGNTINGNVTGSGLANLNLNDQAHLINGTLTLSAGDVLSLNINKTSFGSIMASGLASLSSDTILNVSLGTSDPVIGSRTIITGATGSNINAINVANIDLNGTGTNHSGGYQINFINSIDNTQLISEISEYRMTASSELDHSRYDNVYNNVIDSTVTGSLFTLQRYLESGDNSKEQKFAALDSAEAQLDNSVNRVTFDNINTYSSIISNRLKAIHNTNTDIPINKALWMEAFGSALNQNNSTNVSGYKASTSGFAAGFDRKLEKGLVVGIAGVYSDSNIKSSSDAKKINMSTYQINLYSGYSFEQYFVNSLIGIGFNQYNSNRNIAVAGVNADAKYSGQSYVARFEAGKHYDMGNNFTLTPAFTLTAARNSIGSYDESGAGTLNLRVRNRDTDFLETRFGTTLTRDYRFSQDRGIIPLLSLSYGYDLVGGRQKATTNFIGKSTSFNSSAAAVEKGSVRVGTGIKFYKVNGFSLRADYNFEHRAGFDSHTGSLSGRVIF